MGASQYNTVVYFYIFIVKISQLRHAEIASLISTIIAPIFAAHPSLIIWEICVCVCVGGSTSFPSILFILSRNFKTLMPMFFPACSSDRGQTSSRPWGIFFCFGNVFRDSLPFLKCHVFVVTVKVWDWEWKLVWFM